MGPMGSTEPMDLDERKAAILRAVVEEYVEHRPAGRVPARRRFPQARGVERDRAQRHDPCSNARGTSPSRTPRRAGSRPIRATATSSTTSLRRACCRIAQRRAVAEFFESAHRALEDLLHETSQLLSRVTDHTAMVVGPQPEVAQVRGVQLVTLHPGVVLAVAVLSNGAVEKYTLELPDVLDEAQVGAAPASALEGLWNGCAFNELPEPPPSGDEAIPTARGRGPACRSSASRSRSARWRCCTSAARAGSSPSTSRSRSRREARRICSSCSSTKWSWSRSCAICWTRASTSASAPRTRSSELRDCSIVLAPYRVEGEFAGTVGVLGPTLHGLPPGTSAPSTVVSQQLGRATHAGPDGRCLIADYYDARCVAAGDRRRHQTRVSRGSRASTTPTRTPTTPTPRHASKRSRRLRDAARPRAPPALRRLRGGWRRSRHQGSRGAQAGDAFGLGDLFDAFFGGDAFGGGRGPAGPPGATTPRSRSS